MSRANGSQKKENGEEILESLPDQKPSLTETDFETVRDFFGASVETSQPHESPVLELPPEFELIGTIASDNPADGVATIKGSDNIVAAFVVGEYLTAGISLTAVFQKYVLLDFSGRLIRLNFKDKNDDQTRVRVPKNSIIEPKIRSDKSNVLERIEVEENVVKVSKEVVQHLIAEDLPEIMQSMLLSPNMVDGRMDGFVASKIVPGSLVDRIGLRNGDIIKAVNGTPLNSAAGAIAMGQAFLAKVQSISVAIERQGQELVKNLEVSE